MSQLFRTKPPPDLREANWSLCHRSVHEHMDNVITAPSKDESLITTFFGPEGAGKSYIAAAIHNEWVAQSRLAYWLDCNLWPSDKAEAEKALRRALAMRCLIIDDLGREQDSTRSVLCRCIMSYINDSVGVLIITTNFKIVKSEPSVCELATAFGRAERSRMLKGKIFKVDGRDLRLEQ